MYFSLKSIQLIYKRHEKKKENNSNNYASTKKQKNKRKEEGEKKKEKKGKRKKALSDHRSDDVHTRPGYHRRVCDRFSFQNISLERSGHNPREVSLCTETVHHRLCRHSPRNRLHSPLEEIKAVCSSIILLESSSTTKLWKKTSLEPCPRMKKSQTIDRFFFLLPLYISRFIFSTVKSFNPKSKEFKFYYSGRNVKRFWRKKERKDFLILNEKHRKLTSRPSDQGVARWFLVLLFNVLRSSRSHFL